MATPTRHEGDYHVNGHLTAKTMDLPAGTINNADVEPSAGIDASKLEHQYEKQLAQESGTNSAAESRVIHTVYGTTGQIIAFKGGAIAIAGSAAVSIDLKKNGTTILSSTIDITTAHTAREIVSGTVGTTALAADDVLEVIIGTPTDATNMQGVFCEVTLREDAA